MSRRNNFYNPAGISPSERAMLENTHAMAGETKATTDIAFVVLAEAGTIDEVTATEHLAAFSPWEPDVQYAVGNLRTYPDTDERKLYKCVQGHRSQSDWTPDVVPALWVLAGDPADEWPEWSQPVGAHDAYNQGDKCSHNGKHWQSNVNGNVWEPGVYGWTEQD